MDKQIQLTANDFRIRCSSISKITGGSIGMTPAQKRDLLAFEEKIRLNSASGKVLTAKQQEDYNKLLIKSKEKPELPAGAKTYVRQWVRENIIYKRRKLFGNKYTKKGHRNEEAGRDLVSEYLDLGWLADANDNGRKFSEYIEGIVDVELKDFLIDIKNSFTFDTFPIFETECPKSEYIDQMKGYLHLYKKKFGIIAFVLTDSEEQEILRECNSQMYILDMEELTGDLYESVKQTMTYSDLDNRLRVKLFRIESDPEFIKDVEERVRLCRLYAQEVIDEFKAGLKKQKEILKK